MYAYEAVCQAAFYSDEHFKLQLARMTLTLARFPYPPWHSRAGKDETVTYRMGLRWAGDLMERVGLVAGCIGRIVGIGHVWGPFPTAPAAIFQMSDQAIAQAVHRPLFKPFGEGEDDD